MEPIIGAIGNRDLAAIIWRFLSVSRFYDAKINCKTLMSAVDKNLLHPNLHPLPEKDSFAIECESESFTDFRLLVVHQDMVQRTIHIDWHKFLIHEHHFRHVLAIVVDSGKILALFATDKANMFMLEMKSDEPTRDDIVVQRNFKGSNVDIVAATPVPEGFLVLWQEGDLDQKCVAAPGSANLETIDSKTLERISSCKTSESEQGYRAIDWSSSMVYFRGYAYGNHGYRVYSTNLATGESKMIADLDCYPRVLAISDTSGELFIFLYDFGPHGKCLVCDTERPDLPLKSIVLPANTTFIVWHLSRQDLLTISDDKCVALSAPCRIF